MARSSRPPDEPAEPPQPASARRAVRLGLELLEDRDVPAATYFVLDFTPDYHSGSFADTFASTRTASGYAPTFLDFNRDGWVNSTDVTIAAGQIAARVASYYAPFVNNTANRLTIGYGDVTSNTNLGFDWIRYGLSTTSVQVAVMYLGGTNRLGANILGRAPLAGEGENIEGYGETYTRTIAQSLLSRANATPADFVDKVANTAAHELGHMMGLRHTTSPNAYSIMNPYQSATPGSTGFVYGYLNTDNGYQQNAYVELDRSFQTAQRQVPAPSYSLGGQYLLAGTTEPDGAGEHGCGCDACLSAVGRAGISAVYLRPESAAVVAPSHAVPVLPHHNSARTGGSEASPDENQFRTSAMRADTGERTFVDSRDAGSQAETGVEPFGLDADDPRFGVPVSG